MVGCGYTSPGLCHSSPSLPPTALNYLFSLPEPVPRPEPFRKKEVVEILSHKKAYNTCEGPGNPGGFLESGSGPLGHRALDPPGWMTEIRMWGETPVTWLAQG
jgi:hypothetical protein